MTSIEFAAGISPDQVAQWVVDKITTTDDKVGFKFRLKTNKLLIIETYNTVGRDNTEFWVRVSLPNGFIGKGVKDVLELYSYVVSIIIEYDP